QLPTGNNTIDNFELCIGAIQHPQVTVRVIHTLGGIPITLLEFWYTTGCHGLFPMVVKSPVSTVSPGPKAIPQMRTPSADPGCSKISLSTNSTVALLMLPKLRSTWRDGANWVSFRSSLDSTLSRMLLPPG